MIIPDMIKELDDAYAILKNKNSPWRYIDGYIKKFTCFRSSYISFSYCFSSGALGFV